MRVRYLYHSQSVGADLEPREFEGDLVSEDELTISLRHNGKRGSLTVERSAIERASRYDAGECICEPTVTSHRTGCPMAQK